MFRLRNKIFCLPAFLPEGYDLFFAVKFCEWKLRRTVCILILRFCIDLVERIGNISRVQILKFAAGERLR